MMSHDITGLQKIASQVRRDIVRMVHSCQSGHPGGSLGCADFLVALYFDEMKRNPEFKMDGNGEDVFYLSNGHISPVFYSVLAHAGYFEKSELATFRKLNSRLQGHPTPHDGLPGVRVASGSLGQGLSVAIGHALGKKLNHDANLVFTLQGDGELQEGQNWEAIMFAAHNKVDNLISTVDYNGQQIDGPTSKVLSLGDLKSKFESFGWKVLEIENGNSMEEILSVLDQAKGIAHKGKPIAILLKSQMGAGVDYMMGTHAWHGKAPSDEQLQLAYNQLDETLGDF